MRNPSQNEWNRIRNLLLVLTIALGIVGWTPSRDEEKGTPRAPLLRIDPTPSETNQIELFLRKKIRGIHPEKAFSLAQLIYDESVRWSLDPHLVLGLISVESSFNPRAVSRRGAKGLMQLMPSVARTFSKELSMEGAVFDPELNVKIGVHYLAQLVDRFGDIESALVAYNYGPTYVGRRLAKGAPLPKGYASKVLKATERVKQNLKLLG